MHYRLIAIMLGTFRMDIDTCIQTYLDMAPKIFPKEGFLSGSRTGKFFKGARGIARFDPGPLESIVRDLTSAAFTETGPETNLDATNARGDGKSCRVEVYVSNRSLTDEINISAGLSALPTRTLAQDSDLEITLARGSPAQVAQFGRLLEPLRQPQHSFRLSDLAFQLRTGSMEA